MAVVDPTKTVEELQHDLGLTLDDLALALNVRPRTIGRWLTEGDTPQRNKGRERLEALDALRVRLNEMFTSQEAAKTWLNAGSRYLGGLTPVEVLRAGRIDRVDAALEALESGVFL